MSRYCAVAVAGEDIQIHYSLPSSQHKIHSQKKHKSPHRTQQQLTKHGNIQFLCRPLKPPNAKTQREGNPGPGQRRQTSDNHPHRKKLMRINKTSTPPPHQNTLISLMQHRMKTTRPLSHNTLFLLSTLHPAPHCIHPIQLHLYSCLLNLLYKKSVPNRVSEVMT